MKVFNQQISPWNNKQQIISHLISNFNRYPLQSPQNKKNQIILKSKLNTCQSFESSDRINIPYKSEHLIPRVYKIFEQRYVYQSKRKSNRQKNQIKNTLKSQLKQKQISYQKQYDIKSSRVKTLSKNFEVIPSCKIRFRKKSKKEKQLKQKELSLFDLKYQLQNILKKQKPTIHRVNNKKSISSIINDKNVTISYQNLKNLTLFQQKNNEKKIERKKTKINTNHILDRLIGKYQN